MKIRMNNFFLLGLLIFNSSFITVFASNNFSGGLGVESSPYLISTPNDLNQLRINVNEGNSYKDAYFKLTQNIDFETFDDDGDTSNGNFTPIGTESTSFEGYLDGDMYAISNLKIVREKAALFHFKTGGEIKNLIIENGYFKTTTTFIGKGLVAPLILKADNTSIKNIGILDSVVTAPNKSSGFGAGLILDATDSTIKNSYVKADLTGLLLGGLLVESRNAMVIENSFFAGSVTSYSKGLYDSNLGGVVQSIDFSTNLSIINSYWDYSLSGIKASQGEAIALSTQQFQDYSNSQTLPGFDFKNEWTIINNSPYPSLKIKERNKITIRGEFQPLMISVTIPTSTLEFIINPNEDFGQQFISPTLTIKNNSNAPITVELKDFSQTTNILNDVLPEAHDNWNNLGQKHAKDFALSIEPQKGLGWSKVNLEKNYVSSLNTKTLGSIKAHSSVELVLNALHGHTFSEMLNPIYRLSFIFDLTDDD